MKKFDPTKPVEQRNGRPARILDTQFDLRLRPIVAAVSLYGIPNESIQHHYPDGRVFGIEDSPNDLVNVPEPLQVLEVWFNIYADGLGAIQHLSRQEADKAAADYRIACVPVKITFREGDGIT